ncbi:MAG: S26 family signal peptidase [Ruminococcus sp.]|nr:S26 family signal peptidase [Ruminococcus sp.]
MKFEDYLKENGTLTYTNVGVSMMPLLKQGRDLFTLTAKTEKRCSRGDVVLYKRPPEKYVLHRIVEVRPDSYVILGDNCLVKEYGIADSDILGVMTSYVRRSREHTVNDLSYRLYSWYVLTFMAPRVFFKRQKHRLKRVIKRIVYGKKQRR